MKILHSIHSVNPDVGGPAEVIRQLIPLHIQQGHSVDVACLDDPRQSFVSDFPTQLHAFGPALSDYGYCPPYTRWLRASRASYDAVVVHGLWQYIGIGTRSALRKSAVPYVLFPHGMLDPWFRQAYPLKHLKKLCYWQLFEYKVFSDAEAVLFTSNEEQDKARHSFWPYKGHGEVVGLGTTAPAGNPAAYSELFLSNYPELRERPFLLFLGRIHPKKGCDLLLRAMVAVSSQHPQACLVIAGPESDQYARLLKEQISPEIAQNVVWTGALAGDLKWGALNSAEALVLPSHQENFGMVVAEALACGRPVLLSDKVNTWHDVLEHGAGLVEEDTIDGTRNLLERWFAMSSAEKQAMAERAKQCFSKSFDIRIAHARLIESLERAISSHGS